MTATGSTPPDGGTSHRIVVGVDGSPPSVAALDWAVRQAELTGWPVEGVVAWEVPTSSGWATVPEGFDPVGDAHAVLGPLVDRVRTDHPGVVVLERVAEGRAPTVLEEASRAADLLVVGSRGLGAVAGLVVGSTSEHCVTHASCTVVVVRTGH